MATSRFTNLIPDLPRNVRVLGWVSLLNDVASEMIFPLLPTFLLGVLGGNRFSLGVIEGVVDSASSVVKLWSGGWSDRIGSRKGLVLFGYALAAITRPLIGVITAPWQLLLIRLGDRFGKGTRNPPRDALIADSVAPEMRGRAFGFNRAMDHLGAATGPMLAAGFLWFFPGQLRILFLLAVIPGLLVILLLAVGLREPARKTVPAQEMIWTLSPFGTNFRLYLLALVVFTLGNSSDAFLLVRAGELGVPTVMLPILWCVFHILKSGGNMVAGRAVDKIGSKPMILGGWVLYAGIYLGFAVASAQWQVWLLFVGYSAFYAFTESAEKTLVANLVGSDQRGLAYGWFNAAIGIGTLPASLLFGWLYQAFGALTAFGIGGALAVLAGLMLMGVRADWSVT
ncbi:MAG: MFS transporter [Thermoguttaceae bacterium]